MALSVVLIASGVYLFKKMYKEIQADKDYTDEGPALLMAFSVALIIIGMFFFTSQVPDLMNPNAVAIRQILQSLGQ